MELQIVIFAATYVFVGLGLTSYILSYLQTHHNAIYLELGEPAIMSNSTPKTNWLFLKFIFTNAYRHVGDSKLSNLCVSLKYIQVVWVLLMLAIPAYFVNVA